MKRENDGGSWLETPPAEYVSPQFPDGSRAFIHHTAKLGKVTVGRCTYINGQTTLSGKYPIVIGAFTSIAAGVYCWTNENHQIRYVSSYPFQTILGMNIGYPEIQEESQGVHIGNDVWIGRDARIHGGVTIADGCVIGARAVVTRDCEPYGIYGGVPAKLIRKRFPESIIKQLLALCWWDWPLDKIRRNTAFFNLDLTAITGDIKTFILD